MDVASNAPSTRRRGLAPSGLRHEFHPFSTDDDRAVGQAEIQVPDTDLVIPETQLDNYGAERMYYDDASMDIRDRELLAKNAISKERKATANSAHAVMYLSKEALNQVSRGQSPPAFVFGRPARPAAPKKALDDGLPHEDSSLEPAVADFAPNRVVDGDAGEKLEHVSELSNPPPATNEIAKAVEESHLVPCRPLKPKHHQETEKAGKETADNEQKKDEQSRVMVNDNLDANPFATRLAHPGHIPKKKTRPAGKKGKKPRKGQPLQRPMSAWPPKAPHAGQSITQNEPVVANEAILDAVEDGDIDGIACSRTNVHLPHQDEYADQLPDEQAMSPISTYETHPQRTPSPHPSGMGSQHLHASPPEVPVSRTMKNPPEDALHGISTHAAPARVDKQRKKAKRPIPNRAPPPRPVNPGSGPGPMTTAEMGATLHSIHQTYYAQLLKNQHNDTLNQAKQVKLADLQATNSALSGHIATLQSNAAEVEAYKKLTQEQVEKLRKYVKGIETDHEKFKVETKAHHQTCSRKLVEKLDEVSAEKTLMEQDYQTLADAMEKSQRSMKRVLDDCYVRLEISEAKKKQLMDILKTQHQLAEVEKKKQTELEQQIMMSLETLQRSIQDSNGALLERLCNVQTTIDSFPSEDARDVCLQDCIDALKGFKDAPLLSINDVEKAERMLRAVHENLSSKLTTLSGSIGGIQFPTEHLQTYVHDQLQALKAEVVKYNEVSSAYQRSCQQNEHLEQQLDSEKVKCERLTEQLECLRQSEADLHSRLTFTEAELNSLREKTREHDSRAVVLEEEICGLRDQLEMAQDDLRVANAKLEEVETLRQRDLEEGAAWKKRFDELKAGWQRLANKDSLREKDREKEVNKMLDDLRNSLTEEHQKAMQEAEASYGNNLHRLTNERNDLQLSLQKTSQELDKTREAFRRLEQEVSSAERDAKGLRNGNVDAESKIEKAQKALKEGPTSSTEFAELKEQLQVKSQALESKDRELDDVRRNCTTLQGKNTELEEAIERHRIQLSENHATIDRATEQRKEDETMLEILRSQVRSLEKQKRDLETSLHQSRPSEQSSLENAHADFATERDRLRGKIEDLRTAKQASEQDLQRVRTENSEELKRKEAESNTKISGLRQNLDQSIQSMNESERRCEQMKLEHDRAMKAHKEVTERKMEEKSAEQFREMQTTFEQKKNELIAEVRRNMYEKMKNGEWHASQPISGRGHSQALAAQPSTMDSTPFSASMSNKQRKKVNRQTNTVMNVDVAHRSHSDILVRDSQYDSSQVSIRRSLAGLTFEGEPELGQGEQLDENGVSLREPPVEFVPETQEAALNFGNQPIPITSSPLSDYNDDIASMADFDMMTRPTLSWGAPGRSPLKEVAANRIESRDHSAHQRDPSHTSASRANTASRMVPPAYSPLSGQVGIEYKMPSQSSKSRQTPSKPSQAPEPVDSSSPGFLRSVSSGKSKATYSHRPSGHSVPLVSSRRGVTPSVVVEGSIRKRKSSESSNVRLSSAKKSKSSPRIPSSVSRNDQPKRSATPGPYHISKIHSSAHSASQGSYGSRRPARTQSEYL